jgi:hypothetical protein
VSVIYGTMGAEAALMRWNELFEDLEAQLDEADARELAGEVADRTRREIARLTIVDRLRAALGVDLTLTLVDGRRLRGDVSSVGPDWVLLGGDRLPEVLVSLAAVATVTGMPGQAVDPAGVGEVEKRAGLAFALRRLARDRAPVQVAVAGGAVLTGTIDRVGADYVEMAEHALDDPRRRELVQAARLVPLAALMFVRPG